MIQPSSSERPRWRRELRGRTLFVVTTLAVGALVGYGVSRTGGASGPVTMNVNATQTASSTNSTTAAGAASVGADGPAICAPTTDAAMSGGSPSGLMHSATEVASGTIEGEPWSLWSAKGQSGASGIEDGGVVFNGREYGLCAGYPNPSETEMIDTGGDAIVYGIVNYPGLAKVQISTGQTDSFAVGTVLPSPKVAVVNGVSFYIGTLPQSACSYSYFEVNTTSPSYSAEHNIGFGGNGVGEGYAISNNPGNDGACVTGKLDPLSYSQGIWQLAPGQWTTPSGGRSLSRSSTLNGSGGLANTDDACSSSATSSQSGQAASSITSGETQVASGTVGGTPWTLWAAKGENGVLAMEQGGFVMNGRWYGMCPGAPNPAEFEMIDSSPGGIVYGYVANPGSYAVALSSNGTPLPSPSTQQVNGGTFFIVRLPQSACSYSSLDLNATSGGVDDYHHFDFGSQCSPNQLDTEDGGNGSW